MDSRSRAVVGLERYKDRCVKLCPVPARCLSCYRLVGVTKLASWGAKQEGGVDWCEHPAVLLLSLPFLFWRLFGGIRLSYFLYSRCLRDGQIADYPVGFRWSKLGYSYALCSPLVGKGSGNAVPLICLVLEARHSSFTLWPWRQCRISLKDSWKIYCCLERPWKKCPFLVVFPWVSVVDW